MKKEGRYFRPKNMKEIASVKILRKEGAHYFRPKQEGGHYFRPK